MRAVWWEILPYAELTSARVLGMLAARGLGVYVAVTPDSLGGIGEVVRVCRGRGIRVGVWPMLEGEEGRWPSVHNVERFAAFVGELQGALAPVADELVLDLEPPIEAVRALGRLRWPRLARGLPRAAVQRFGAIVRDAEEAGMATLSAAFPLVLADGERDGWQRLLGTPVDATRTSRVSAMLYTSIAEGTARGLLSRRDVMALLGVAARATVRRYGARASVSVGAVDTGVLGDEPVYRDVSELAEDVGIVRGAGIQHIILFSLCGALRRGEPERWLDALSAEAREPPRWTVRAAAASLAAVLGSRALSVR